MFTSTLRTRGKSTRSESVTERERAKTRDHGLRSQAPRTRARRVPIVCLPLRTTEVQGKTLDRTLTCLSPLHWPSNNPTCTTCMDIPMVKAMTPTILDTEECLQS